MGQLPFEKIPRVEMVRQQATSSPKYGSDPYKRPIKELLDYGVVNIDKPSGPTSHQVSAFVQKILNLKKSGHSGTLDPKVTGILAVAIGRGTRISQSLLTAGKEYICLMHVHDKFNQMQLMQIIKEQFTGKIKQLPPIKSAVKRQHRYRKIYYIEIIEIKDQDVLFKVGCQAGTYIRKLCLHPSTEIITNTGQVDVKHFTTNPSSIFTVIDKKVVSSYPNETQKFSFDGSLYTITMQSGISFKITPEHKMLISTPQGYVMKQAQALTTNDYVVKSLEFTAPTIKYVVADLLDDAYLVDQPSIVKKVKTAFIKKYGSIRAMNRKLGLDRKAFIEKSSYAIPLGHIKKSGIYDIVKKNIFSFKSQKGNLVVCKKITSDLSYLLGLLASDGNNSAEKGAIRRTRIKFHNKERVLVDTFKKIHKKLFPNIPISEKIRSDGLIQLDSSNSFLATLAHSLGVSSPQKKYDLLPILHLEKKLLASFMKGYFDGDGTAYYKKNKRSTYSRIDLFTISEINAKRLHQILLKLDITTTIFKKKDLYVVSVNSISSKKKFISQIGSFHPLKKERFDKILTLTHYVDNVYANFEYKELLKPHIKILRKHLGGNIDRVLKSDIPITRSLYLKAKQIVDLPHLDNFQIEKIRSIKKERYSGYVYDMTVPKTHNFLIETGFVSSNCHDIGQALGSGAHMAELRRSKAGPFNEGTNMTTLQDLTDAYHYYKEEGDESYLRKLIYPVEFGVSHLPKVWIVDSAVDSICNGASLKVPGIARVESEIQADELAAIVTLKGELVAVGKTLMASKEMVKAPKGIAIRSSQVFMQPGVYPRMDKPKDLN